MTRNLWRPVRRVGSTLPTLLQLLQLQLMLRKMNPVQRPSRLLTADEVKAQLARQREKLSQAAQKAIADYAGDKELTAPTDFDNQDFYEDDLETLYQF